ncbi:hypothetical protein CBER1_04611 [Cercospora berteroae]|uniref:Uncharacterized protein n=1 Tax=Cercospora berteroae TaxID=357750 RepID=A0A2S6C2F2_9PEZI|nr:hypothetical protein CBER1_04611 [Cercospora berteroae]
MTDYKVSSIEFEVGAKPYANMSSHKQIDVTQDIMQQLPGEVVAHIASFTEKKELDNLRLVSHDAEAKSDIEFAKRNLRHLRIKITLKMGGQLASKYHTDLRRIDCSDIEAAIKIIDDNNRGSFVQDVTFGTILDWSKAPAIDLSGEPQTPDQQGIETSKAARLLNTLLSKLTSLREVSLYLAWPPVIEILMHVLRCQPQLPLTSMTFCHGCFCDDGNSLAVISLFAPTLRSLHFIDAGVSRQGFYKLLEHIRDGKMQLEEFTDDASMLVNHCSHYLIDDGLLASSKDLGFHDPEGEYYDLQPQSAIMKGRIGVKKGAEEMLRLMRTPRFGHKR